MNINKEKLGVIDLSLPIEEGMLYYPTSSHHPFKAVQLGTLEKNGRITHSLKIGTHCGTHIDAFTHFLPGKKSIDQLEPEKLTGPAVLINLGTLEPGSAISKESLESYLPAESYSKIVLRTDWSRFWNTSQYYDGWPHLTADAVDFLLKKGIHLLGLDFPSPDLPFGGEDGEEDSPWHKKFFQNEVILVEYMNNLKQLDCENIFLMAFPLRLTGLDGSPARVMAYPLEGE
jgi:arylformamidase